MGKNILAIAMAILTLTFLSACQTTGSSGKSSVAYNKITSESAFIGGVVGKTLLVGGKADQSVVIAKDNTWSGDISGKKMAGTWKWDNGYWCRTMDGGKDDCQEFAMSSMFDSIKVTRDMGKGKSWIYKISMK